MCGRLQIIHPMTNVPPPPCLPPPSGAGCSGRPQATYCDRPITPGKVPLPRFLGGKKENSSTKMPRCCITYCPKNAIGFVKPWQGAWCFCGLENSDAGLSSPAPLLPPSENGRVLSQQWPTSFAPPSVSPQFIFKMHSRSTFRCRVRRCQSPSPSGSHSHRRPRD